VDKEVPVAEKLGWFQVSDLTIFLKKIFTFKLKNPNL